MIIAVSFTAEDVFSKLSVVSETALRVSSFQSYFFGRLTTVVKTLRPPYSHRSFSVSENKKSARRQMRAWQFEAVRILRLRPTQESPNFTFSGGRTATSKC